MTKTTYDPATDFTYIIGISGLTSGLVVRSDAPWKTFGELLADAKANPGKISYGSPAGAANLYIVMQQIAKQQDIKWTHIPFKSFADRATRCWAAHPRGLRCRGLGAAGELGPAAAARHLWLEPRRPGRCRRCPSSASMWWRIPPTASPPARHGRRGRQDPARRVQAGHGGARSSRCSSSSSRSRCTRARTIIVPTSRELIVQRRSSTSSASSRVTWVRGVGEVTSGGRREAMAQRCEDTDRHEGDQDSHLHDGERRLGLRARARAGRDFLKACTTPTNVLR